MGARAIRPASVARRLEAAVAGAAGNGRVVLAVSGGRDSMVLLHAAAAALDAGVAVVATFDHGTGRAAERAVRLVAGEAGRLGFTVVTGRAGGNAGSEAGWRAARWAFLRDVAARVGGRVLTAHSLDDQVETVLMRILRGAGARGMAGLYAPGEALRPFLEFSRAEIAAYAARGDVRWLNDPTNDSPAYLRNRVRRDLLPALRRVAPGLEDALLESARRATEVRGALDAWARRHVRLGRDGRAVDVPVDAVRSFDGATLALVWPAIAAMVGLAIDRRGTDRAVAFTSQGRVGSRITLSGGWSISRSRDSFTLRRASSVRWPVVPLSPGLRWDAWTFEQPMAGVAESDPWVARLPRGVLEVRAWRAGDRMEAGGMRRKVKRFLSDGGITGELRPRWPVVLHEGQIVWIPGVRRSDAASVRPGRPAVLYRCDHDRR